MKNLSYLLKKLTEIEQKFICQKESLGRLFSEIEFLQNQIQQLRDEVENDK